MKTINNFINEKLKISSRSNINIYTCQPEDYVELRRIVRQRLNKDKNADLNDIDVSKITDISYLFEDLDPHNIDISEWDVSKVENMKKMFRKCEHFNCDLSKWDVSNVTNMNSMFEFCLMFNSDLNNWNVSKVEDMAGMFVCCEKFNSDLGDWKPIKVNTMYTMFDGCLNFTGNGLENWDVTNVQKKSFMFHNCKSLKNIPSWYNE